MVVAGRVSTLPFVSAQGDAQPDVLPVGVKRQVPRRDLPYLAPTNKRSRAQGLAAKVIGNSEGPTSPRSHATSETNANGTDSKSVTELFS